MHHFIIKVLSRLSLSVVLAGLIRPIGLKSQGGVSCVTHRLGEFLIRKVDPRWDLKAAWLEVGARELRQVRQTDRPERR